MNEKELCFIINNERIYLECILAEDDYVPIFFLCKSEHDNFYLSLRVWSETTEEYIVIKLTKEEVVDMLHGKIPMRDVFLNQKYFWKVISGDEIEKDNVTEYPIEKISKDDLPYENAYFVICRKYIREYVKKFES